MRFLQFYTNIESFNYFTDKVWEELSARGYTSFICDLTDFASPGEHGAAALEKYLSGGLDVVLVFDGLGIHVEEYWQLWNRLGALVVNMLWDPPFRFHPQLESANIERYLLLCPDERHITYIRRFFPDLRHVSFMPHGGTALDVKPIPYRHKEYSLLFSGTYYRPEGHMEKLRQFVKSSERLLNIYMEADDRILRNTALSVDEAIMETLEMNQMVLSPGQIRTIMTGAVELDWKVRMLLREKVVTTLLDGGIDLFVLGRGWRNHPRADNPHMHILSEERIPFHSTLEWMDRAKINLNVMPWFKAGTHDRIFNAMLRQSVVLTDPSQYLDRHFKDGESIAYYSLQELDRLPEIVTDLLSHPESGETIAQNGYKAVQEKFTWQSYVDRLLTEISRC